MISLESFKEKYDYMMTLSGRHPSLVANMGYYFSYIEQHLPDLGEVGGRMYDDLRAKITVNTQIDTMREMCLEIKRIGRSKEILLNKAALSSYIFARIISSRFLSEVKLSRFFDVDSAVLFKDKSKYLQSLSVTFEVFKNAKDRYDYYTDFKMCLIFMIGNGMVSVEDIGKYLPVIRWYENDIKETNTKLSLREKTGSVSDMTVFGVEDPSLVEENGKLSSYAIMTFLERGIDFLTELSDSGNAVKMNCAEDLISLITPRDYDPICDYIFDGQHGTNLLVKYTKEDVSNAQKLCLSILNIYTSELLLQTALSDYYDVIINNLKYDLDSILETSERNLSLLRSYDIITIDTQNNFMKKIKDELSV